MIEILLNGKPLSLPSALPLQQLLEREGLVGKRVAVERNGEIVARGAYAATRIESGDRLEIVVAVGGG